MPLSTVCPQHNGASSRTDRSAEAIREGWLARLRAVVVRRVGHRILILGTAVLLAACAAAPTRVAPLPEKFASAAAIPGIAGARYWGDTRPRGFDAWLQLSEAELAAGFSGIMNRPHDYLALSGGGSDGAFGAGLLVGWTEHGSRPQFTIVTGISTGALIAPFAFLGPRYDETLRKLYTSLSTADLVEPRSLLDIVRNDSATSSAPLRRLLEEYIDDRVIAEIAAEHRRGRSLLIGTTNLDAARPVTWNITRIAASGAPHSRKLIHDVILASASIPGIFPPVIIDVEADGKHYDEMHVDGGVTAQVFAYPSGLDWRAVEGRLGVKGRPNLYVINNSRAQLPWDDVERRIVPILLRTVDSLIRTQGIGDLAQIYLLAQRDGLDFRLAYIPTSFAEQPREKFDPVYMRALFDLGYSKARSGYPWTTGPER